MSSTLTGSENYALAAGQETLVYWPKLSIDEQAFVIAYIENGYLISAACEATGMPYARCQTILKRADIKKAIAEAQNAIGEIDFLNEKWVKAQLLRLYPMVMGDEAVPMVTSLGDEIDAKKFHPDVAMRILEYVAPKTTAGKANGNTVAVQVNFDMGAMGLTKVEVKGQD